MATLEDVARSLGLSKRSIRLRMTALGDLLEGYLSRGPRNQLILQGEAVAILERLEQIRREERIPIREAAGMLKGELYDDEAPSSITLVVRPQIDDEALQDVIRELVRDRDHWRDYAMTLQSVLPTELRWLIKTAPPLPEDRRLN